MTDVIVWTKFNTTGFRIELENNPKWLKRRIEILNKISAPSLRNQSDTRFTWVIEVREDTYTDCVNSFNVDGINVCILPMPKKGEKEEVRKQRENATIENYVGSNEFYFVRLNSDDMYHKDFIKKLKALEVGEEIEAIIPVRGYYWYIADKKLVQLNNPSPPFYAFIYNTEKYLSGYRYPLQKGHRYVKKFKHIVMNDRLWVWVIHDINNKILRIGKYPSWRLYKKAEMKLLEDFR